MTTKQTTLLLGEPDEANRCVPILASTKNAVNGEALASWDLERFKKNPVLLWAHKDDSLPVGYATDIEDGEDGLTMVAHLVTAEANPLAENVWQSILQKSVRAVSVGFAPGKPKGEEDGVETLEASELLEVSFVPVPADENAGTADLGADEEESERKQASERSRTRSYKGVKLTAETFCRDTADDYGRLGKLEMTQVGGARVPATLCRVGVLTYRLPDGSIRRDLRLPEEVFHPDSIASLAGAPVIDIADHTALVTPETYRKVTLGHAEMVKGDGEKFVSAELVINDAVTLDRIERGERTEISCGYVCRHEEKPGTWRGLPYDVIQRGIRYNHVALCPPSRGRAGPEVGLHLDANEAVSISATAIDSPTGQKASTPMKVIILDGKEYEVGSEAHINKLGEMHAKELAALTKTRDELKAKYDAADEEVRKLRAEDEEEAKKEEETKARAEEDLTKRIRSEVHSVLRTVRLLGEDDVEGDDEKKDDENKDQSRGEGDDPEKKDDEDKDKKEEKLDSIIKMSPRQRNLLVLKKFSPRFDAKDESDDYVRARAEMCGENVRRARGIDGVVTAVAVAQHLDARDAGTSVVEKARAKRDQAMNDAWKTKGNK